MAKVGIMGGTFDPIHNGHLRMASAAYEQFHLDQVLFMPSGIPPHKSFQKVSTKADREAMTKLAIQGIPYFAFSDMECKRQGNTYTADTLTELTSKHPENQYYYIVGADSLDYMDKWYHPEIIFKKAVILAARRNTQSLVEMENKADFLREKYHGNISFLSMDYVDVSSSEIRKIISSNEIRQKVEPGSGIDALVPFAVAKYIYDHNLYTNLKENTKL